MVTTFNNLLQSDAFKETEFTSNSLVKVLNKFTKKSIQYPYTKIKKFIAQELQLPTGKKTLDNINVLNKKYREQLLKFYKLNVLLFEDNAFVYYTQSHDEFGTTKVIFIFNDPVLKKKYSVLSLNEKHIFKISKLPEELCVLLDPKRYINKVILKNDIKMTTLDETVETIQKDTCKDLNDQEKEILFSHFIDRIWAPTS